MEEITKDWTILDIANYNEDLLDVLAGFGMHCFTCPLSQMETLEEACMAHGLDLDFVLKKLNEENK